MEDNSQNFDVSKKSRKKGGTFSGKKYIQPFPTLL